MPTRIVSTYLDHSLTPAKGWFQPAALDFQAGFDVAITFDLPSGRCCFLYTAGRYPKNCKVRTGVSNTGMPLFVWHGPDSLDVINPGTASGNGRFMWAPTGPTGIGQFLVAAGGYELETTEFDGTKAYPPNALLTATAADTNATTGGRLTSAGSAVSGAVKQTVDTVVGVTSRGVFANNDGVNALAFWTWFIPGTAPS